MSRVKEFNDVRFWLTTFFEKQVHTTHQFKSFKREIENNGCFIVKSDSDTVKIYTPELAIVLTSKELPARNIDTQTETTISGWDYLSTYIEAYKEGEKYFESEFKVSPNILYGENAEHYIRDIHFNFFHVQHNGKNEGWGYVKKQYPNILTHKAVKEFGYYSGIVSKIEVQISKYPKLFATFDKCEHNLQTQQPDNFKNTDDIKELHNHIFKGNAFEVFEKYHYNKSIQQNSRTDLNLLFQLFKNDSLFVETVELKHYIKWLNETYCYDLTELKKVDINSKPNIQRINDYKEYKKTTLKQP